jgi:hypothetical protein
MASIPKRWRFQFSLRSLLAVITALAVVPGGWLIYEKAQARRHAEAARKLRTVGAEVYAKPKWLWTRLEPDSPGVIVGLGLRYRKLTDADLHPVSSVRELVWLDLNDTPVGDNGLVHLSALTGLKRLRLDETQVTDAGLAHLAGLSQLQQLNLYKTQITDAGLVHLASLTNLKELNLQRTHVTAIGVAKLQKELPKCQIAR